MCDFSGRLIAWMDGELPSNEAAVVEQHVAACADCRDCVAAYEEASRGFAAYYHAAADQATAPKASRRIPLWVPVLAATAAAVVLLLALLPRTVRVEQVPAVQQVAAATQPVVAELAPTPVKVSAPLQRRHVAAHKKAPAENWAPAEPAIQIAIPAEAMFPPGAVPEGVNYIASLSLADGSVRGLRLQP
jgi:anti-sigma factor RsiW